METINERIIRYRKFAGINQTKMAEMLGIKVSSYSQKERRGIIDCETLKRIAEILNINIMLLLYGEEKYEEEFVPVDKLSKKELDLITIFRNVTKEKKERIFKFAYYTINEK